MADLHDTRRQMHDTARKTGEEMRRRLQDAAAAGLPIFCTVNTVTAGAAADGNALVTVTWRGGVTTAGGYANSYTPVAGDRVICAFDGQQLVIYAKVIGHS